MRLGDGSALVGGTGTVNQTGGSVVVAAGLFLGSGSGAGTYNLGGTGTVSSAITYVGEGCKARFNQSGGTFNTGFLNLGIFAGSDSVYSLSGGALNVLDSMNVGAAPGSAGVMNQSGGNAAVTYVLTVNGGGNYNLVLRGLAGPLELRGISDPAALPLLLLVGGVWSFALMPLVNAQSRSQERAADRYALATTHNVDAFVTAMKRLSQQNLAEEHPSQLVRWLFYSHPPIHERIEAARAFSREDHHAA